MIKVFPKGSDSKPFTLNCAGGHARWLRELSTLTFQADAIMDPGASDCMDYLGSPLSKFDLEIVSTENGPGSSAFIVQFLNCSGREVWGRDLKSRPYGQRCRRYQVTVRTDQFVPATAAQGASA